MPIIWEDLMKFWIRLRLTRYWMAGRSIDSSSYGRFKELIAANHIKYSLARAGQVIGFDSGIKGYILNPNFPFLGDTNSDSIVMRLVYGDVAFLFTGDLGKTGEERILSSNCDLHSTVLKVGHHGSSTSTSDEFLRAVNPQVRRDLGRGA